MQENSLNKEIENLKKENKKLKRINILLSIYVILSVVIYLYNYFA